MSKVMAKINANGDVEDIVIVHTDEDVRALSKSGYRIRIHDTTFKSAGQVWNQCTYPDHKTGTIRWK